MNILYFVPHKTIYAGRTIYEGYKNAFTDLGHTFRFLTSEDEQEKVFAEFSPHILFTSIHAYLFKYLNLELVKKQKRKGMKVFVNLPMWHSPLSKLRVNEPPSISQVPAFVKLIKSGDFGDMYYNVASKNDKRMEGFESTTGYTHYTIPLAADKLTNFTEFNNTYAADISFLGTNLPDKQAFFKEMLFPLKDKYTLRLYGQDWNLIDKYTGYLAKLGMYFNLPVLKDLQKPKLPLSAERQIYASSTISLNIHEGYQREYGGDCNERTFKIPLCGGFEISDNVAIIREYFTPEELVIAESKADWFEKIEFYLRNPEKRLPIIEAGKNRVLKDHTYHARVLKMLRIYAAL